MYPPLTIELARITPSTQIRSQQSLLSKLQVICDEDNWAMVVADKYSTYDPRQTEKLGDRRKRLFGAVEDLVKLIAKNVEIYQQNGQVDEDNIFFSVDTVAWFEALVVALCDTFEIKLGAYKYTSAERSALRWVMPYDTITRSLQEGVGGLKACLQES